MAQFPRARVTEGVIVVSLVFLRRWLSPLTAAVAAAALALGPAALSALADGVRQLEWWLAAVHVTQAWQVSTGVGVTVAVLDTGVDPAQRDLSGSVITGPDYTKSGRQLGDPYWGVHGTAVAALIAGHGHGQGDADGVIGVAPEAKILSVRVKIERTDPLHADPAIMSRLPAAIAAGIRYAARHGAQIIDLPLDPGAESADGIAGVAAAAGGSAAERNAVAYALAKGALLVAPAGDDGPGPGQVNYPAAYPGVISAGAFGRSFDKAAFSSRRPYVTLTAPGAEVITASSATGYTTVSSTSAASAEVAGIAALIRSRYPDLTPRQVRQALTAGTRFGRAAGRTDGSGYGTADAMRALNAAAKIDVRITGQPAAAPSPAHPARAQHGQGGALVHQAVIGAAILLVLLSLGLAVPVHRRRRAPIVSARGQPLTRPRPAGASVPAPGPGDARVPAGPGPQPPLAPIPKLAAGRKPRPSAGPPWGPAPKPAGEPPSATLDSAANGDGAGRGISHQADARTTRDGEVWRAVPGSAGAKAHDSGAGSSAPSGAEPADGSAAPTGQGGAAVSPVQDGARVPSAPADGTQQASSGQATGREIGRTRASGGREDIRAPGGIAPEPLPAGLAEARSSGAPRIYVWNPGAETEAFRAVSAARPADFGGGQASRAASAAHQGAATAGAETQEFPAILPPEDDSNAEDDQDDRPL